jgi:hypothetical protein
MKNKDLRFFEDVKKIEILYPDKDNFVFYNDILKDIKIKINDTEIDTSKFNLKSKYIKQIRFETAVFSWLESIRYIKNFKEQSDKSIIPTEDFCHKNNIEFKRFYKSK